MALACLRRVVSLCLTCLCPQNTDGHVGMTREEHILTWFPTFEHQKEGDEEFLPKRSKGKKESAKKTYHQQCHQNENARL